MAKTTLKKATTSSAAKTKVPRAQLAARQRASATSKQSLGEFQRAMRKIKLPTSNAGLYRLGGMYDSLDCD